MRFQAMTFAAAAAGLVAAKPIQLSPREVSDFPYGIDPTETFNLRAIATDNSKYFKIVNFYSDFLAGKIALKAIDESVVDVEGHANFTLQATHYGTRLYVYAPAPCTSAAYCDDTPVPFGNQSPVVGGSLTFTLDDANGPTFGGLAFYGQYSGTDPENSYRDLLTGAGDSSLQTFTICKGQLYDEISYKGANTTAGGLPQGPCTEVYLSAIKPAQ